MLRAFDDREKSFEAKYRLDQEMEFKARMRRDKLLGLWAAERMEIKGDAALAYALEVVEAEIVSADHDAAHKVVADLNRVGIKASEAEIRHQMAVFLEIAREQITTEMSR